MQNNLNLFIAAITDRLYAEGSRKDNPLIPRGLLLLLQRPAPQTLAFVPDTSPLAPAAAFTPQLESALPAAMSLALAEVFHPVLARFLTHQEVAPPYPVIVAAATLDLYKVVLLPHTLPSLLVSWKLHRDPTAKRCTFTLKARPDQPGNSRALAKLKGSGTCCAPPALLDRLWPHVQTLSSWLHTEAPASQT